MRVRESRFFIHCLFGTGGDDEKRKKDLSATYVDVLGTDWAKDHHMWFIDGFLRGDRERIVQGLLPAAGGEGELYDPRWPETLAAAVGVADEPRLKAHFAEVRARLAQARAELPQRLKEKGLTLLP
jgi:hypothetical protein